MFLSIGSRNYRIISAKNAIPLRRRRFIVVGEFIERRQGGDFVTLGEGRIIEYRIDEVIQFAAVGDDRLADMDKLGGALADHVDAE